MGRSRQDFETVRDAATVVLGCGLLSLGVSAGIVLLSVIGGYGAVGWLAYSIGPVTLLVGVLLFPLGVRLGRRSARMRADLEGHSD